MYNKVILLGRITRDLELKTTQSGTSVLSFGVAVDRRYQAKGEERKADFFNCVAWRELAEHIARNWTKGKPILVEGELQNREYTDKNGVKRIITEVIADRVSFTGDSKKSESGTVPPPPEPPYIPKKSEADTEESLIVQGEDDDFPF